MPLAEAIAAIVNNLVSKQVCVVTGDELDLLQFRADKVPSINLGDYLNRITRYAPVADELLIISLIYIDRLIQRKPLLKLNVLNIHRLILTTLLVSIKFYSDVFYSNAYFAQVCGIMCIELNSLERTVLRILNFDLLVPQEEYFEYSFQVEKYIRSNSSRIKPCTELPLWSRSDSDMSSKKIIFSFPILQSLNSNSRAESSAMIEFNERNYLIPIQVLSYENSKSNKLDKEGNKLTDSSNKDENAPTYRSNTTSTCGSNSASEGHFPLFCSESPSAIPFIKNFHSKGKYFSFTTYNCPSTGDV